MLAEDEIRITIGAQTVLLRPTLRAAMRLERLHGGIDKIILAILSDNVTMMASVIRESEDHPTDVPRLIEALAEMPLVIGIATIKEPLIRHVLRFIERNSDGDASDNKDAEPITFAEHYTHLYRIATGWLGWSPEVAWTSTASEISEAFKGRAEMLKAIFGTSDKAESEGAEQTAEAFNGNLSAVLAMASARFPKPSEAA